MLVNLNLPARESLANIGKSIIEAVSYGEIPADQGAQVMSALTGQAKLVEVTNLEARITKLEEASGKVQEQ